MQFGEAVRLVRELDGIGRALHRLDEVACERDLEPREASRRARLEQKAARLVAPFGLRIYRQRDPRGAALYVYDPALLRGRAIETCYDEVAVAF